ncbi:L,D-transpeptidase family protein [Sphingomonas crocodyli]|uniref:L,D-TPase catalytic domain-containing protein n=1 Tax=Sphingomonas crocodyli TaxID=1979270 RepID=A0A437MAF8_9SPHN|nr:L,D-transpeptidase family protein [Sphingomonas crocodyli]RVT94608.1 hypothetical protein EOD43_12455 [Sphingomonas crocodyli]
MAATLSLGLVAAGPLTADKILIDKSDRTLTLFRRGVSILQIRNIRMGAEPVGHKHFEGDERTPEGRYYVSERKADSRYHRALRISYPNTRDRAFAARNGRSPGGDVMIHGQPNFSPFSRLGWNWTDGCVAVSDREMDRVWQLVPIGTPIDIRP